MNSRERDINGQVHWLEPTQKCQILTHEEPIRSVEVAPDFYVAGFLFSEVQADDQLFEDKN